MENKIAKMMNSGAPMNVAMELLAKIRKNTIASKANAKAKKPDIRLDFALGFVNRYQIRIPAVIIITIWINRVASLYALTSSQNNNEYVNSSSPYVSISLSRLLEDFS